MSFGSGGGGPIASAFVEIQADTTRASGTINSLLTQLESLQATIDVDAETGAITVATEAAVDAANTIAEVEGDAASIPATIEGSVESANTVAEIEGEAASIPAEIEGSVDAANKIARIEGEAVGITQEVEDSVQSADSTVQIDGDLGGLSGEVGGLRDQVDELQTATSGVTATFDNLRRSAAFVAVAATVRSAVLEAERFDSAMTTAETAIENTNQAAGILLDDVTDIADRLSLEIGVDTTDIVQAQAVLLTFDNISGEIFERTLNTMADLGAVLGTDMQDATIRFGRALNDPVEGLTQLSQLGIRFSDETREQIRVLADAGDALGAQELLLDALQREVEGMGAATANTTDIWRVAGNTVRRDFGAPLLEVVNTTGPRVTEAIMAMGPAFTNLGETAAPVIESLIELFISLEPAIGATTTVIAAATPALEALATTIEAIPDPLLQAVAAFTLLRTLNITSMFIGAGTAISGAVGHVRNYATQAAAAQLHTGTWRTSVGGLRGAVSGLTGVLSGANLVTAGLALGAVTLANSQQQAAQDAADHQARVEALRQALREADTAAEGLAAGLQALAEDGDETSRATSAVGLTTEEMSEVMLNASSSADALATAAEQAGVGNDTFINSLRDGNSVTSAYADAMSELEVSHSDAVHGTSDLDEAINELGGTIGWDGVHAIERQIDAADEMAEQQVDTAFSANEMTESMRDQILESDNIAGAYARWHDEQMRVENRQRAGIHFDAERARAMGEITNEQFQAITTTEDLADAESQLNAALADQPNLLRTATQMLDIYEGATGRNAENNRNFAHALEDVSTVLDTVEQMARGSLPPFETLESTMGDLHGEFDSTTTAGEAVDQVLGQLAVAADAAGFSGDDLAGIAQDLGVELSDLEWYIDAVNGSINDFVSGVESAMPQLSDHFDAADGLTLNDSMQALEDFRDSLSDFGDNLEALSPWPALQQQALEGGAEWIAVLGGAAQDGRTEMLDEMEPIAGDILGLQDDIVENAQTFAFEFALAMGYIAEHGVEAFGDHFDLESPTRDALEGGANAAETGSDLFFDAAGRAATKANSGYLDRLEIAGLTSREVDSAILSVEERFPWITAISGGFGTAANEGAEGSFNLDGIAGRSADHSIAAIWDRFTGMTTAGDQLGGSADTGLGSGMSGMRGTASSATNNAIGGVNSPGNLSAASSAGKPVGEAIAEGIRAGIAGAAGAVAAGARAMAQNAVAAAQSELKIYSPSRVFMEIGEQVGDGFTAGIDNRLADAEDVLRSLVSTPDIPGVDRVMSNMPSGSRTFIDGPTSPEPAQTSSSNDFIVNMGRESVVINVPQGTTPRQAETLGRAAERGFMDELTRRQIHAQARST